jgi:hypothetical protein
MSYHRTLHSATEGKCVRKLPPKPYNVSQKGYEVGGKPLVHLQAETPRRMKLATAASLALALPCYGERAKGFPNTFRLRLRSVPEQPPCEQQSISVPLTLPASCQFVSTQGYIEVKSPAWGKGVELTTKFDSYGGDIIASDSGTPLQVQLDVENAQERRLTLRAW